MKQILLFSLFICLSVMLNAQTITGKVVDGSTGEAVIGASVILKGTSTGTITDIDGRFNLMDKNEGAPIVVVSFMGYSPREIEFSRESKSLDLGMIALDESSVGLEEIVVTGVVDLVKDRQTPVAVSTIKASEIQLKLGNQEFPEIMKTTPSVYATKQGGGYGDSRINVRGFNQRNVSVIINGQPVNDMENGWVYWSNWAGLQDIASGVEIQRGIGASKLAVPSVGGTINVVTKSSERQQGGFISLGYGNDGYLKTTASYSTGQSENGWSASALLGRWQGNGWVDGTKGEGYNYLAAIGYEPSENHAFNFTFTGAGQWHHQRSAWLSIDDFHNFGGEDGKPNRKFNADWGMLDGKEYTFRRNFYNKPIATINYDWKINDNLKLSNSFYGSWGRGGGTGPRGRNFGIYPYKKDLTTAIDGLGYRTTDGLIDFDKVVANNKSTGEYTGNNSFLNGMKIGTNDKYAGKVNGVNSNVAIRRSSVNSHNWYGGISNLEYNIGNVTLGLGLDGRTYTGLHYRVLNDLLGLDGYMSMGNKNARSGYVDFGTEEEPNIRPTEGRIITTTSKAQPFSNISNSDKLAYYNIGKVNWLGVNGLAEYASETFTAVVQSGVSNQWYKRVDYFAQLPAESDVHSQLGGFVKGGLNYNLNNYHNVFANAGYISKQPIFDAIFPNYSNKIKDDIDNEQIVSFELGYGLRMPMVRANVNLYRTTWGNRFLTKGVQLEGGAEGTATFDNLKNIHSGVELDAAITPIDPLTVKVMASLGNWTYNGNVEAKVFDDNQNEIGTEILYLEGVKVGDAAQTTFSVGLDYEIIKGFKVDATWLYFDNLFADFNVTDSEFFKEDNKGSVKLPSYNLLDLGASYRLKLNDQFLTFRVNVNNVLDTEYLSELKTNVHAAENADPNTLYKGIDRSNFAWYGFGRTWNLSLKYNF